MIVGCLCYLSDFCKRGAGGITVREGVDVLVYHAGGYQPLICMGGRRLGKYSVFLPTRVYGQPE